MTLDTGSIVRATATFLDHNDMKQMNVYHYKAEGTGSAANLDVFTAISAHLVSAYSNIVPKLHIDYTAYELLVDEVSPTVGPWEVLQNIGQGGFIGGAFAGEDDLTDPLPPSSAALLRLVTVLRKHQGRKYLGGFTEASNDSNGRVNALTITTISAMGMDLLQGPTVANSALVLRLVIPNMAGFATNEVVGTVAGPVWRNQRRRQAFVGI